MKVMPLLKLTVFYIGRDFPQTHNESVCGFQCYCRYLLGKTLCVLQAVCEGLDEKMTALLTQSIVVPTFLAGLGQQSEPDLGH